jgi:hypothetical protein
MSHDDEEFRPTSDNDEVELSHEDSPLIMVDVDRDHDTSDDEESGGILLSGQSKSPLVLPRQRFAGACNVDTVKDGEKHSTFNYPKPK